MIQWGVIDPEKIRRAVRVYRAASAVGRVHRGLAEIKHGVGQHTRQVNAMLNASELAERIREKRVEPEDVRGIGRAAVKSMPRVYNAIAGHIRMHREKSDAKT